MIEVAKKAVLEAGKITLALRSKLMNIKEKGGDVSNLTTEADIESEKKILAILRDKFPKHSYLSEEIGKEDNHSDYWWVIDPIDGTGPYYVGLPTYGISIGLIKNGHPYLGVIYLPFLKSLFWAERGKGAFLNKEKIYVSRESNLSRFYFGFDLGWANEREEEIDKLLKPIVGKVRYTPILGCTVAGMAYVACGIYDAYAHWAYPWDFAAGAAIIEEAGGKVTDYWGKPINWFKEGLNILASNGKLHKEISALIKK